MSKTPTPETDSVTRSSDETPWTPWVCAGHAKRLERERDEARRERGDAIEELALVRKQLVAAKRGAETNATVTKGLFTRLADAKRERDDFLNELVAARRERDEAKSIISRLVSRRIISWGDVDSVLGAINEEEEEEA
jgi:chromosome segregation ATPase